MEDLEQLIKLFSKANKEAFNFYKLGNFDAAKLILEQVLKVKKEQKLEKISELVSTLKLLGVICYEEKEYEKGIEYLSEAILTKPEDPENYYDIGLCYSKLGLKNLAASNFNKAIEIEPRNYFYNNLGLYFREIGNLEEAISTFKKSLELINSDFPWCMLGGCYTDLKNLEKAEECFSEALKINPNCAGAHVDLACVYQLRGEWEKAWPEYEWRFKCYQQNKIWNKIYDPDLKWKGEDIKGKSIIVHSEQGHGDTIQFFRYVPELKQHGAKVILHCSELLETLFKPYVDQIFTDNPAGIPKFNKREDYKMPQHDYHISIMSLPLILGGIPKSPYIQINEKFNLKTDKKKVGIVWAGNPEHFNDANRSCHVKMFKDISKIENIQIFSLQKDKRPRVYKGKTIVDFAEGLDQINLIDMSEHIKDFLETAKIVSALDLLITVDTSVLHLAGALGVKTWALIPFNPDWRWKLEGENEWYESVTLMRQKTKGDWGSVFEEITKKIREL